MEKNYFYAITLLLTQFVFAQTYTENFDSCTDCTEEFDLTSESTPGGFWNGSANDSFGEGWRIKSGSTGSSFCTGPDGSYSGLYYAYTETSSGAGSSTFILESDGFSGDVTEFSFYYHMYGQHIGTLTAESSSNSGTDWTAQLTLGSSGQTHTDNDDDWTQATVSVPSGTNKLRIKYVGGGSYCGDAAIDDIVVTISTGPSIFRGYDITGLNYEVVSGPSSSQSTTVSGTNLTNDITLTAPTNFEISESSSSGFTSSITLTPSGGSVSSTTIYARLKQGLGVGSYSGDISCSSSGATAQTISLSGSVSAPASGSSSTTVYQGTTKARTPMRIWYDYNYSQQIYYSSDIGSSGEITGFSLEWDGSVNETRPIVVYMAHTDKTNFDSASDFIDISQFTEVYDGSLALTTTSGWVDITLDSGFDYDDSQNLVIAIDDNDGSYAGSSTNLFLSETTSNYQSIIRYRDGTNISPSSPGSGYRYQSVPNLKLSITVPATSFLWDGSSSTDWSTTANWNNESTPTSAATILIPADAANMPVIDGSSGEVTLGGISMDTNASLTIEDGGHLTIDGPGNISGDVTITDGGSLIASDGSVTGTITYNRSVPTTDWYLISCPVSGQDIDTFVSAEGLATGTGNNMGFADFNNNSNSWSYYQNGASGTGPFNTGQGHSIKLATTGTVSFSGTFNGTDADINLTTGSSNNYNLIGNPYLASVSVVELLNENSLELNESTVWVWDKVTSSYGQKNLASDLEIAPGQGFFVETSGNNVFSITEAMQSHTEDTFLRLSPRPEIELTLSDGSSIRNTDIFYIEGTTTGFDNGYDSTLFGGSTHSFEIYTHLVSDSQGQDFGIQSLPDNNYEDTVIPVGVNAVSGTDITISALASNLPAGISLFLEDKTDDSFTLLDEESNYSTTLESDAQGIGRYYLHTTSQSLDAASVALNNNISVYKSSENNLRIVGVQSGMANIYLYNTIGKQVLEASFMGSGVNDIELPELSRGVYIVKLSTLNGVFNKKIIID